MDGENKIAVIIRITANVEKSCGLDEHSARGVFDTPKAQIQDSASLYPGLVRLRRVPEVSPPEKP